MFFSINVLQLEMYSLLSQVLKTTTRKYCFENVTDAP